MASVAPTVLASDIAEYNSLINNVLPFAERIHLDFMDGIFAPTRSINVIQAHWPEHCIIDLHLMLQNPLSELQTVISRNPYLAIVHAEADGELKKFGKEVQSVGIKFGIALLVDTSTESVTELIEIADHVLVFAGHLGHYGGKLDTSVLSKIDTIKQINPSIEVGVDGGVNAENANVIVEHGADVLYSGGYIQKADDPRKAYDTLVQASNRDINKRISSN